MLSTVSVEAVYSATYVENYLDCMENFPDELQRLISRIRELDVSYLAMVKEVQDQKELYMLSDNPKKRARIFTKMQHALIQAQELGDEKMAIMQNIHDKIETKTRLLDQDYKNLDFGKEEPPEVETKKEPQTPVPNNVSINNTSSNHTGEKPNKRVRRSRNETTYSILNESQTETPPAEHTLRSQAPAAGVTSGTPVNTAAQKKTGAGTGKKKKRKSRQGANAQQNRKDDSPPPEEPAIDPDEPTYCLCDQISFGEMIMCDNDLCPIEWFHFSCVELSTKPKGKWFCPKCRGDRPNVMKPKAQFLKELEKYNKEKEEKT